MVHENNVKPLEQRLGKGKETLILDNMAIENEFGIEILQGSASRDYIWDLNKEDFSKMPVGDKIQLKFIGGNEDIDKLIALLQRIKESKIIQ